MADLSEAEADFIVKQIQYAYKKGFFDGIKALGDAEALNLVQVTTNNQNTLNFYMLNTQKVMCNDMLVDLQNRLEVLLTKSTKESKP